MSTLCCPTLEAEEGCGVRQGMRGRGPLGLPCRGPAQGRGIGLGSHYGLGSGGGPWYDGLYCFYFIIRKFSPPTGGFFLAPAEG